MINTKKLAALGLSLAMLLTGGALAFGEEMEAVPISAPIEDLDFEYIRFDGKVEEIDEGDEYFRILVRRDTQEGLDVLYAYIHEDMLLLSQQNMDFAQKEDIQVGMDVSVIYHKTTVMAMSYPPLLGPNVVVLHDGDEYSTFVEHFDEELLSADGYLRISIGDETVVVDWEGNEFPKDQVTGRDLVLFYSFVLESYPAQTTPHKVIVMPEREEEEMRATIVLNVDQVIVTEDGVRMIPLRLVAEALGFEVTWNAADKSVETLKGNNWSTLTIGRNVYNFARMLIRLETAPVIIDGSTYVPLSFSEQVLQANVEILNNGSIVISE